MDIIEDAGIPDMAAYADRIGIELPVSPDLDTLVRIILCHQLSVPFENLLCHDEGRIPDLDIPSLFDKVVTGHRGGYCFELNALFLAFLRGCGYDAWPVSCCVLRGKTFVPPMLHRATVVRVDDRDYFADVGYGGPQPAGPVPLGGSASFCGERFMAEKADGPWWRLSRVTSRGDVEAVIGFWDFPMNERYFIPYNHYCAVSPDSVFVQRRLLNLRTPDGSLALTDDTLTERRGGEVTVTRYEDADSLAAAVRDRFGIDVPAGSLRLRWADRL